MRKAYLTSFYGSLVHLPRLSLCLSFFIKAFVSFFFPSRSSPYHLPPGPPAIPIITALQWLRRTFSKFQPILRNLHAKYGPIIALRVGSRPAIIIADRTLAHQALIQNGAVFADRPKAFPTNKILSSNQHNISSALYGSSWRTLRRNLTSEILHPSRIKSFAGVRKWVLDVLLNGLKSDLKSRNSIKVIDHLQYAMFCLLFFMCSGEKVDEQQIKKIEYVIRSLLLVLASCRYNILNFWPTITKILFQKRWEEFLQLGKNQEDVLIPLIRGRRKAMEETMSKAKEEGITSVRKDITSYADTLLVLQLPEDKRELDEAEMVSLCSEFLNAGTDATSAALQWIMANLVKYPHTQQRLLEEIKEVMGDREEDLNQMPYLKAVVLEGLRRHPPGHFALPHAVTEDVVLNDYLVPKNGFVNFMVAKMGWDPKVWEDPVAFKPERFLNSEKNGVESFTITGSRKIKMMPFGAGRWICPGFNLAILHLEYFVANLVRNFEWRGPNGGYVDLSEKQEFIVVMRYPLQAHITPRF